MALVGEDRPGIVAALTGELLELGCNLEDLMTGLLSGHFAMMLVCSAPEASRRGQLESRLRPLAERMGLSLSLWDLVGEPHASAPGHLLTIYGPDRAGIVHRAARALAEAGANICDMTCRLAPGDPPLYLVTMDVAIPPGTSADDLERKVSEALGGMGLDVSLRTMEPETL